MEDYKINVVSEHLKDRHPYNEPEFNDRYDQTVVTHAVFDRTIPKLIEILKMVNLQPDNYKQALMTLNQMVCLFIKNSHQETKVKMISQGLIEICSKYIHNKVILEIQTPEIRRESIIMLGSLLTIKKGLEQVNTYLFDGLRKLLFDPVYNIREICGFAICRIVSSREGVEILVKENVVSEMIKAFLQITQHPEEKNGKFITYILEAFLNILQFEEGIVIFLNTGILKRFNTILLHQNQNSFIKLYKLRVNSLLLNAISKITVNMHGKKEGIEEKVITTACQFLISNHQDEIHQAVLLIMNCAIHLDGKKQATYFEDDQVIKVIIIKKRLISLLDLEDPDLRINVKQAIINIFDLPDGKLVITKYLSENIQYLEEIIGPKAVKPLADILINTSQLENPPFLPQQNINYQKQICTSLCYFIKKYDEAVQIAIEDCVKLVEKIAQFLIFRGEKQLQDLCAHALSKICSIDDFSREQLCKFLNKFGDRMYNNQKVSLNSEIQKYQKLVEYVDRQLLY